MSGAGGMWRVRLDKHGSIWSFFTTNPQGGGFGSSASSGDPQWMALAQAVQSIPPGTSYRLVVNGRDRGERVRGAERGAGVAS